MPLIDPTRIINNLIVLGVLGGIFFLIYSKLDKEQVKNVIDGIKRLFGKKEE